MGHYRTSQRDYILSNEEFTKIHVQARTLIDKAWIIILWLTAARPAEALDLTKKDIVIMPDKITFRLKTLKLGEHKKFTPHIRNLGLKISAENELIKILQKFLQRFQDNDSKLFQFSLKHGYNIINNNSRLALNKSICPYNFRHSRLTLLAEAGASKDFLMRFKGSFTDSSVREYLHVRQVEYNIDE